MSRYLAIRAACGAVALALAFASFDAASAEDAAAPPAVAGDDGEAGAGVTHGVEDIAALGRA